ncbi:unnamed protein product [Adineta steineri]|uniref:Uncharacterized protein n=1 Tax=Adineta steineri TaxID=433720 RepID=A0A818Z385_9BILA|nr:unnamed protein product [Adineta steineri]CAF3764063.1 unnamed protein product [Adineta steineri]CAF4157660.1 unnamed protein product [Adineta steineri]
MTNLLVFFIFSCIIPKCLADMTGTHYLDTVNCSSSSLYVPQGPYLISHHWPFTSITIQYEKQITRGTCYRDGSIYFVLNNNKVCSGLYFGGQARLLCRYENEDYCVIHMKTADGSRLTCDGSKIQTITIKSIVSILFILFLFN